MATVKTDFAQAFDAHQQAIESIHAQLDLVHGAAGAWIDCLSAGGKVLWFGNGGSAADAQHMAAELMVRYVKNRAPLASIALNTDTSILTAHSNDFEFATVFARQVEALAKPNDVIMALSTSGNSQNVVLGAQQAKKQGCKVIAMTGRESSQLSEVADICFQVDSIETARIQEAHSFINHLLCEALDGFFG